MAHTDIATNFISWSRGYLSDEYRIKIRKTVLALPDEMLWWRPNEQANSVGNLLMHLEGNVRQWIIGGVGGAPDVRDRGGEFAAREGMAPDELLKRLDQTLDEADAVLSRLRPEQLTERRRVQTRDVSVLEAIYQVVQHFALHLGQIILVAKAQVPGAVKFYEDAGGAPNLAGRLTCQFAGAGSKPANVGLILRCTNRASSRRISGPRARRSAP